MVMTKYMVSLDLLTAKT